MYYSLQNHCILVEGEKRGAIYDFSTGKVFSINENALLFLKECQNKNINDIIDINSTENNSILAFLDELSKKGLCAFYINNPNFTNPLDLIEELQIPQLEFLWLELTSACNNFCLHCYSSSSPRKLENIISLEKWLSVIEEAKELQANAIQLIGGEPLLYPHWQNLVEKAYNEKFEFIEIFTNATLINDSHIDFFKSNNVSIATTIYADNALIHDKITQNPGSFFKTINAIEILLENDIPLRIASIIMKDNENEAEKIMQFCEKLGVEVTPPDVVRPTGRGNDKDILPASYARPLISPPFNTDEYSFYCAQKYHSCLRGKLAITATGDVIPCIFARDMVCGNILSSKLSEIIQNKPLNKCWNTTKDKVKKCNKCEYRYACTDCRALCQNSCPNKDWFAAPVDCTYNPSTGNWE
ncbi:radical SAM protein [Selenomonadales bacterium OttesenSCG-928-I06]|nr:radical SAM protein [Selenomonadales bacterium OttesenSCG-928-I06]